MAAEADTMNLRHLIDTFRILNMSHEESTVSEDRFPFQNSFKDNSFIVSDVDQELLLLVEFLEFVDLHNIKIHAFPLNEEEEEDIKTSSDLDTDEVSLPKQIQIFKIDDLSKDFNDVKEMKANYSLKLKPKKLVKGQMLNLKKKSKTAVAFKKVRYLAIFIESNQDETEKTLLSGIIFRGKCDAKLAYDIPHHTVSNKKKQKNKEIVAMFDRLDKKKVNLSKLLTANRVQSVTSEATHSLLSYISRLPQAEVNQSMLQKLFMNENDFGTKWIQSTLVIRDKDNKLKTQYTNPVDTNPDKDYEEKMSYALMKILCDEEGGADIQAFLQKKMESIVFHCMLMFHPSSEGNIYHAIDILKCLFKYYPIIMYEILTHKRLHYVVIQKLFRYAMITTIHHAKFDEFLWLLLVYNEKDKQRIAKLKVQWMDCLRESRFIYHMLEIAEHPKIYGIDIANKYGYVIVTLMKQCAKMKETTTLLHDKEQKNIFAFIVDKLLKQALDTQNNDKWYRIHCLSMVLQTVGDLSDTKVLEYKRGKVISSSHNHAFALFGDMFNALKAYMTMIVNQIIDKDSKQRMIRLGMYRSKGLELLLLYLEIGLKHSMTFEQLIENINIKGLCTSLISMALNLVNNNLFLVKFRRFVNILDEHSSYWLKYMFLDCKMMAQFIEYYSKNTVPSATKSFIITMLWDIKNNCNQNKKWNFAQFVDCNQEAKQFMSVVERQMNLRKPTKVT